jgi:4-amino-4-deoxy-L-arabinose transferase-like glycosyltransferase
MPALSTSRGPGRLRRAASRLQWHHLALVGVLALSAVLNTYKLSQNGYANIFYSAGVKSMLRSWHNFFFVSFDPGGLITVDKPPLGLWLQAASAKVFGFSPLSLLLPEAILGVLSVALLYRMMTRRFGPMAALASALALAIFPAFVAVSRSNGVDPLLIFLMVAACAAALRSCETGGWTLLLLAGALVGLAFNTKSLAAYLVVPGIALGFLLCAPGSILKRVLQLLAAGLVTAAVSFAWIAAVEATPASKRPYVGSSTNNTEIGLAFEYNGFGRVGGQSGGPGHVPLRTGAVIPFTKRQLEIIRVHQAAKKASAAEFTGAGGAAQSQGRRKKGPTPFGGPASPWRLWGKGLGDQAGWLVPIGLFGLIAAAMVAYARWRAPESERWRDPRLAALIVLGGWFAVEALVLSFSKGIVHPYYTSALAPGTAAMVGAGAVAFVELLRGSRTRGLVMVGLLAAGTTIAQGFLLYHYRYIVWFIPVLLLLAALIFCALVLAPRLAAPGVLALLCLFALAPAGYASTTWLAPVEATFPAAGPTSAAGVGGVGINGKNLRRYEALISFIETTGTGKRWPLLTVSAPTAAPFILLGVDAGALAGYSGTDPAFGGPRLAGMVARHEARYVLLGGEFASRGGNAATAAVLKACRVVNPILWKGPPISPYGLDLFDCAGRERELDGLPPPPERPKARTRAKAKAARRP